MQPKGTAPPHYECLGVDPSIDAEDLARHYKKLSLQLHPDRAAYRNDSANEVHVQARYRCITEAYAVLSDTEKRRAYDTKHGVNFRSRLARLQDIIDHHHTMAGPSSASPSTFHQPVSQDQRISPKRDPAEDTEDDEYDPNEVAAPPCGVRQKASSPSSHVDGMSDGHEDGDGMARLFSLSPRLGAEAAPQTRHGVPMTQYQDIVLTREPGSADSPYARTWGLVFDNNELVGICGDDLGGLERITGLAAIPFPCVVQKINGTTVLPTTDVLQLLSRGCTGGPAQGTAVGTTTFEAAPPDGTNSCKSEVCLDVRDKASSISAEASSTEQLHLLLAYSTVAYDLVGEVHLLHDDEVMARLAPSWCIVPQLRPLIPDATVRCVNNRPVRSVTELRAALRVALFGEGDEDTMHLLKRARTSRTVAVEFCQLPFL